MSNILQWFYDASGSNVFKQLYYYRMRFALLTALFVFIKWVLYLIGIGGLATAIVVPLVLAPGGTPTPAPTCICDYLPAECQIESESLRFLRMVIKN